MNFRKNKGRVQVSFTIYLLSTAALFFFVIAIAISALVSNQYSRTMWSRQLDSTQSSMAVSADQIAQVLNSAKVAAVAAREEAEIAGYLYGNFSSESDNVHARRAALNKILLAVNKSPSLQGLFFLKADGSLCGYSSRWSFLTEEKKHPFAQDEQLKEAKFGYGATWIGPYQLADLTQNPATEVSMNNVMILGAIKERYLLSYEKEARVLVTLAAVSVPELCDCFDYLCTDGDRVTMVNGQGECIISLGAPWQQGVVDCWPCLDTDAQGGCMRWDSSGGEKLYVVYQKIPSTDWFLVKTTSAKLFQQDLKVLRLNVVWITLGLLVATIAFYAIWSHQMTRSLERLSWAMEKMREGDLSLRIQEPMRIREYETIRTHFNRMADSIEQLLKETKQMERDRVTLEARALQTQLSPHMIFNSISAIRWMATALGVEQISGMLGALAKLLHPVFREWRLSWTIREELAHLDNYIVLLKLRYGDAVDLHICIPEEMRECLIPCFVLQPVLENCFEHSTRRSDVLSVSICAMQTDDRISIAVEDNGGGIEPKIMETLRAQMARTEENAIGSHGIGLYNVHRKLQLLCGRDSGITIESNPGIGTKVTLKIRTNVNK